MGVEATKRGILVVATKSFWCALGGVGATVVARVIGCSLEMCQNC